MSHLEPHIRSLRVGLAVAALSTAASVHAQTLRLYVDASAPAGGDGRTWSHAMRDLRVALSTADLRPNHAQPVEIRVAQGIYSPDDGTHNRNFTFAVGSAVSLLGACVGLAAGPTGDPDQRDPDRFVSVLSGDLLRNDGPADSTRTDNSYLLVSSYSSGTLDGFTLRGAAAALIKQTAGGTVSRCIFTDNISTPATVLSTSFAPPVVVISSATIRDCTFVSNRSALGSILTATGATFQRCTFAGNRLARDGSTAPLAGAAIDIGSNSSFDACLFAANVSETLGLSTACGTAIYNCTIVDNRALSAAGVSGCALQMYNCIFSRNIATNGTTQQVYGYGPILFTCFLDHGLGDVQPAPGSGVTGTLTLSGTPGFMNASGPDGDPLTWADNDYRLGAGSPCIDHGNSLYLPDTSAHLDRLGLGPFDDPAVANTGTGPSTIVDVGAFERAPIPCRVDFDRDGTLSPTDVMAFISAWLSGNPSADFDSSGALAVHDILEFIGMWFAGC